MFDIHIGDSLLPLIIIHYCLVWLYSPQPITHPSEEHFKHFLMVFYPHREHSIHKLQLPFMSISVIFHKWLEYMMSYCYCNSSFTLLLLVMKSIDSTLLNNILGLMLKLYSLTPNLVPSPMVKKRTRPKSQSRHKPNHMTHVQPCELLQLM